MVLTIINQCNRDCPYCFEGDFRKRPRQMMTPADVDHLCHFFGVRERPSSASVSLMGGEPTLHPQLFEIVDVIRSHNPTVDIVVLTNLTCTLELTQEMIASHLQLLVNIVEPACNTPEQQEAIDRNLELLLEFPSFFFSVAVTITRPDESFEHLYELLRRDRQGLIRNLRVGIASPGMDFTNVFVKDQRREYGDKYLEVVRTCHQINPRMLFTNECAVNLCLMSEEVYDRLSEIVVSLSPECTRPNLDVLPDFSTHWCFAFQNVPEMRIDNIFRYADVDSVYRELYNRLGQFFTEVPPQCDFSTCEKLVCKGPCHAINYYRRYVAGNS